MFVVAASTAARVLAHALEHREAGGEPRVLRLMEYVGGVAGIPGGERQTTGKESEKREKATTGLQLFIKHPEVTLR
eukprot:7808251-Pyramimonas_sp.AAC.1